MTIWYAESEIKRKTGLSTAELSKQLTRMSLEMFAEHPLLYLESVARSWVRFWGFGFYHFIGFFKDSAGSTVYPLLIVFGSLQLGINVMFLDHRGILDNAVDARAGKLRLRSGCNRDSACGVGAAGIHGIWRERPLPRAAGSVDDLHSRDIRVARNRISEAASEAESRADDPHLSVTVHARSHRMNAPGDRSPEQRVEAQ